MNISTRLFDGLYNIERSPDRVPHTCMWDRIPFFFSFSPFYSPFFWVGVCAERESTYIEKGDGEL
jgi:hypothetical protein